MTTINEREESRAKEPPPKGMGGFFGTRTGWVELRKHILLEPILGGSRWSATFGSLLLFAFTLQVVTGILLTTSYAPSTTTAWQSVNYIQHEAPLGWLVRGLHHWGSSAMVILLLVHLIQVFVWGAYKRPRELTWMSGVLLLACTLGLGFTGYLLPWDQRAYWASKVGMNITGTAPVLGTYMRKLLQGGEEMGNLTLTRFFTLHGFVLPGSIIALVTVHMYLFRRAGVTTHWWKKEAQLLREQEPFWPGQVWKDGVIALVLLVGLVIWTLYYPAPLGQIADPSKQYEARPEWYFMFLFLLLRFFEGPYAVVGTVVLPGLFFAVLFFWPLLDRNPERDPRKRPVAITLLILGVVGLLGLTTYSIATDKKKAEPEVAGGTAPVAIAGAPRAKGAIDGASLYASLSCIGCHEADGTGSGMRSSRPSIPDFTSATWQTSRKDDDLFRRIYDGKEDDTTKRKIMPSFKDELTVDQIHSLVDYVRTLKKDSAS